MVETEKTLGFKPGSLYKQILDDVLKQTLDHQIGDQIFIAVEVKVRIKFYLAQRRKDAKELGDVLIYRSMAIQAKY